MFANKIRSRMSKPIFLTFILTLIISCATHTPNPSSWLDKRSTPVTQDSICRLISYCQTQANIGIQHGNYAEALYWKDETLRLKDTLLSVRNSSGISHTPMINYSQILLLIIICLFTFSLISLFLYFRHRKLKVQYEKLSETIKHREWSFMMTKEFITENHIAYDELERLLNREKASIIIFGKLQKTLRSFNPAKSKFFRATNLPVDEF